MKISQSDSFLTLKCELLFQMTAQSYLSLFTLTIVSISISELKDFLLILAIGPMSLVKI